MNLRLTQTSRYQARMDRRIDRGPELSQLFLKTKYAEIRCFMLPISRIVQILLCMDQKRDPFNISSAVSRECHIAEAPANDFILWYSPSRTKPNPRTGQTRADVYLLLPLGHHVPSENWLHSGSAKGRPWSNVTCRRSNFVLSSSL